MITIQPSKNGATKPNMKPEEMIAIMKRVYELKKTIKQLNTERIEAERAIYQQFQVDECNRQRDLVAKQYQTQIDTINQEIIALELSMGDI